MRRLDRLLGNAACSMLATAHQLAKPFAGKDRPIKKIAVMKFFGMGSIIVASQSLAALRDHYPDAELHFVTFKSNKVDPRHPRDDRPRPLRRSVDAADVPDVDARRRARAPQGEVRSRARPRVLREVPARASSLAGIRQKAGFYLTAESWRRELLDITGIYNCYFHTSDIFLSLVYLVTTGDFYYLRFKEFAAKYRYPKIEPSEIERAALRAKLAGFGIRPGDPLFVINANTSPDLAPEARKWPQERYAALADELVATTPNARALFIGAAHERDYVTSVANHCKTPRRHVLAGDISIRELLVLFAESKLVVSNDSGPMHLACLVDAPIIGLFFADSPTLFAPLGSRARSVAPDLYSIPLFSVYNGKDVAVGKPSADVGNAAACTVPLDTVMREARELLAMRPVLSEVRS